MSVALFLATAVLTITVIVLTLLGLAYLAHRHNQTITFKVVAGGGLTLALICFFCIARSLKRSLSWFVPRSLPPRTSARHSFSWSSSIP